MATTPSAAPSASPSPAAGTTYPTSVDTQISGEQLALSAAIYGSLGLLVLVLFSVLRKYARRVYSPRKHHVSARELPPADLPKSVWRWVVPLLSRSTDDLILKHVGLDAFVTIRFLMLGWKLFAILMPLGLTVLAPYYASMGSAANLEDPTSRIDRITLEYITNPERTATYLLWLPVVFVYGYTAIGIWLLHREYLIIIPLQREFKLFRDRATYTVLVERIPREIFSKRALRRYFESVFPGEVLRVDLLPLNQTADTLKKLIEERTDVLSKLERATFDEHRARANDASGEQGLADGWRAREIIFEGSKRWMGLRGFCYGAICKCFGREVEVVDFYTRELESLNSRIAELKTKLERETFRELDRQYRFSTAQQSGAVGAGESASKGGGPLAASVLGATSEHASEDGEDDGEDDWSFSLDRSSEVEFLLKRHPDGLADAVPSAAFVTFKSKTASTAAGRAFIPAEDRHFLVTPAPEPRDVNWGRLGCNPSAILGARIAVLVLNLILLILFGTLTSTISATTNLEAIRKGWAALDEFLKANPWATTVFDQIAPLLLIIAFALVPPILNLILELRFEVSGSAKENSFFLNYSAFLIVQLFLFYQLSGAIFSVISTSWDNPREFINVIAAAISRQATFFMQFMLIRAFWVLPTELIRLGDVVLAFLVTPLFCGIKRTPRERRDATCGCRDLTFAGDAWLGSQSAHMVLILCIGVTYSVLAPLSGVFALAYFSFAIVVCRNQLLYVYVKNFESGGSNWPNLALLYLFAFGLFQISMLGIFALAGAAAQSVLTVFPLVVTASYACYMHATFEHNHSYVSLSDARRFDVHSVVNNMRHEPLSFEHPVLRAPVHEEPALLADMLSEIEHLDESDMSEGDDRGRSGSFSRLEQDDDRANRQNDPEDDPPLDLVES